MRCRTVRLTRAQWRPGRWCAAMTMPCATLNRSQTLNSSVPTWAVESGILHHGHKWVFLLLLSYLDKSVKIRSDDQPPVPHIVSSPSSAIPYVPLVIRSMLSDIHFVMLLLYDVFGLPRLRFPLTSPGSHTSPARTRRLSLCVQSRRVCDVQQILEAVWGGCFRLFGVQSNCLETSNDRSTVLLIGSFSHQLFNLQRVYCFLLHVLIDIAPPQFWSSYLPLSPQFNLPCSHCYIFLCDSLYMS